VRKTGADTAPRTGARGTFRQDIQGLRALAVILVILNHADVPGFRGGYIGVDVFFVISGYVITQLLLRESVKGPRQGLPDFYSRRIRRLLPAASATLVGTILLAWLFLGHNTNPNLPGDVRWSALFAANFRLILTNSNYFVPGIFPSLITQFWSLAVEEQFYLLFPFVVFLIARSVPDPARRIRVLSVVLAVAVAVSSLWSIIQTSSHPTAAYYSPLTRFWELGLGCLLATLTTRRPTRTVRAERLAVGAGVILLVVSLMELNSSSQYPGWLAWLPCGAAFLLIWAGVGGERTPVTRLLATPQAVYIGALSYSLYLTHYVWLNLPEQLPHPLTGWFWRVLELAGTAVTSVLMYRYLEDPIRKSKLLATDRVAVILTLCVCIAASWAASIVVGGLLHT
jgi:peptidoglycan/LPS O-acetylase OafA/YrhL